ncbi:MAG: hypothetical protein IT304_05075 [Dehalococcoidia bacterium]|nr:hypothetical protein [Dehalococcoidia bacterium]
MRKWLILPAAMAALVALAGVGGGASARADDATLKLRAGDGEPGYAVDSFLPANVTIITGTTLTWSFPWYEPHSVSMFQGAEPAGEPPAQTSGEFPNDTNVFHSGVIFGDPANPPTVSVKFVQAGTYQYFCVIHPFQIGQVTVLDPGSAGATGADNQYSLDARGAAEYSSELTQMKAVAANLGAQPVAVSTKAGGASQYTVRVGATVVQQTWQADAQQFFPPAVNIKEGDSIVWRNDTETPHTVTIGPPPAFTDVLETPIVKPAGGVYTGGNVNSGTIWSIPDPTANKTFELVFAKQGAYNYYCILHENQGMVATVNVATGGRAAPGAPNTGSGAVAGGGELGLAVVAGAVLLAAAVAAGAVMAVRREGVH